MSNKPAESKQSADEREIRALIEKWSKASANRRSFG